ncbi:MAG: hypothetical protein R2758_06155 [Bacteroidales bacterium]
METVDKINLKLRVVRIAFLQLMLVLLQCPDILLGAVAGGQSCNLGLEEAPDLNYLQYQVRIEPQVIKKVQ